jgi:hypothetical protein
MCRRSAVLALDRNNVAGPSRLRKSFYAKAEPRGGLPQRRKAVG